LYKILSGPAFSTFDNNAISRENAGIGPFVKGYPLFRAEQLDSFEDDEKIWSGSGWVQGGEGWEYGMVRFL